MKAIFQVMDELSQPRGGRVFIAPDKASLDASIASSQLNPGWTMVAVSDESEIVSPPPSNEVIP